MGQQWAATHPSDGGSGPGSLGCRVRGPVLAHQPSFDLLRATLLQILYWVRSERLRVEQIDYNLLFRWFIGLSMDDLIWDHSTFTKNLDRPLEANIARRFVREVVNQARGAKLLSDEHFSVDGTLIQAWASMKRFRHKGGSGSGPGPGPQRRRVGLEAGQAAHRPAVGAHTGRSEAGRIVRVALPAADAREDPGLLPGPYLLLRRSTSFGGFFNSRLSNMRKLLQGLIFVMSR